MSHLLLRADQVCPPPPAPHPACLPGTLYSVQEKADANQLADHTSRTLNLGLLLSALGHLVVLGPMANEGTGGRCACSGVGCGCRCHCVLRRQLCTRTGAMPVEHCCCSFWPLQPLVFPCSLSL